MLFISPVSGFVAMYGIVAFHLREVCPSWFCVFQEDPKELSFWLEDLYTPGYDSLLKKKAAEMKRNKICKTLAAIILFVCVVVTIITVAIVVTRSRD